ncbi:MAG: hypothetical protein GXO30_07970 [Epsilonproteobacteria bacterium]|nr:hypothetical protein [Campylobacterota bacterium]
MVRLNFVCEFKSDIVLHSSSNIEGKIDRFDYIAGSNFLGMVARKYPDFGSDAFEIFHSGVVRFGDGHILKDNQETFQVPFAWFAPKGVSLEKALSIGELYNEHFLTKEQYDNFIKENKQPKQQRVGFVTANGELAKLSHNYRQKSAYDKYNRRSKDSAMFGYYSLPKGTKWAFSVEMDSDEYKDKIIELLESSKRLGKSRSAEYGRVKITFVDEEQKKFIEQDLRQAIEIKDKHYIFLYAQSRLALTNNSINSYKFDLASLQLEEPCKIAWDKSQIRTSRYTPYVFIRENRDPERLVIDKGSVIAIEVSKDFDVEAYSKRVERGLGLYLSEGHGKVVVNPKFLTDKNPKFKNLKTYFVSESEALAPKKGAINQWLQAQQKQEEQNYKLLKEVKEFIKNYKKEIRNKKSQWGQIRSLCSAYTTDKTIYKALFSEKMANNHKEGFLLHGQAKDKWSKYLIEALTNRANKDNYHTFIKLLSIYAPKEDDKKGENNE